MEKDRAKIKGRQRGKGRNVMNFSLCVRGEGNGGRKRGKDWGENGLARFFFFCNNY